MSQDDRTLASISPFAFAASQLYPSNGAPSQNQEEVNTSRPGKSIMTSYVMKSGDTLWGLSQKTGIPLEDIQAANAHIGDPTKIQVGTAVNLPLGNKSDGDADQPDANGVHASNSAGIQPQAAFADNQPIDEETAKKYRVEPGTTWRIVNMGQKMFALNKKIESGTATRAEALSFMDDLAKLRYAPDLSPRELQEARQMALWFVGAAHPQVPGVDHHNVLPFEDVNHNGLYGDAGAFGMPSGGGAVRLPGAPLGAGMNMFRPGDPAVVRLNQQMGLSLPRSPLPRDVPAPPVKRRP